MRAKTPKAVKASASAGEPPRIVVLDVDGHPISLSVHSAGPCAGVLAPGAGGTRNTPQLLACASSLDPTRYTTILLNFPYQEARRKFPDRAPRCEATFVRVVDYARGELGASKVVIGGRSMGGRMAGCCAADPAIGWRSLS